MIKPLNTTELVSLRLLTPSVMSLKSTLLLDNLSMKISSQLFKRKKHSGLKVQQFGKDTKMPSNLKKKTGNTPKLQLLVLGNLTTHQLLSPNGRLLIKLILIWEETSMLLLLNSSTELKPLKLKPNNKSKLKLELERLLLKENSSLVSYLEPELLKLPKDQTLLLQDFLVKKF